MAPVWSIFAARGVGDGRRYVEAHARLLGVLAPWPPDVHGRELRWRHLVLVTAENLSVREDSRQVICEHDRVRACEAHRWPMLAEPPRRRELEGARGAVEELQRQLVLELPNLPAEGRLRHAQAGRSAAVDHGDLDIVLAVNHRDDFTGLALAVRGDNAVDF